jgi:tetratricopeptide (TPR) repeat protein
MKLDKLMRKTELEAELVGKGDFIQIDTLNRFLKLMPPMEMKKFAYLKLAEIYENKEMFNDAAEIYRGLATNAMTFADKIKYHILETKSFIRGGFFDEADKSMRRAIGESNEIQQRETVKEIREFYKQMAEEMFRKMKASKAATYYEKLLRMKLSDSEKTEVKTKLKEIYLKLGKMKEIKLLEGI